jgi:hypothetical protein
MLENIKCSCSKPLGDIYLLILEIKSSIQIDNKELFKLLNIKKDCCKLKLLTCSNYVDYMTNYKK